MNGLKITDITVWPLRNPKPGTKLKANCRITFNDCIYVSGKIYDSVNGLFLGPEGKYGEKKDENGKTIFYPSWKVKERDDQDQISKAVVQEYLKISEQAVASNSDSYNNNNNNNNKNNSESSRDNIPF